MHHFVTSSHHTQLKVLCKWKYENILIMAEEKRKCTNPPMLSLLQPSTPCKFWTKFASRMLMWHKTGHVIISNLYLTECNTISYPLKSQSQSHGFCSIFHSKSKSLIFYNYPLYFSNFNSCTYITDDTEPHILYQLLTFQTVLIYLKVHLCGCKVSVQFHTPFMTFIPQKNLQWRIVCSSPTHALHAHPMFIYLFIMHSVNTYKVSTTHRI